MKSPCENCLIFSCCSLICDEKINFTAEHYVRFKTFFRSGLDDERLRSVMKNIWKENQIIGDRCVNRGLNREAASEPKFSKALYRIEREIKEEPQNFNALYCTGLLMK